MSKAAEHLAYAFDLIDPVQMSWMPGDQLVLFGNWITLDHFDYPNNWWVTTGRDGSRLLVTPENLPKNRAQLMHQGRVVYSPDAPVRNATLARASKEGNNNER